MEKGHVRNNRPPSLPALAQLQTVMKRTARRWAEPIESGAMGRGVKKGKLQVDYSGLYCLQYHGREE